jgi:hypothetical protein
MTQNFARRIRRGSQRQQRLCDHLSMKLLKIIQQQQSQVNIISAFIAWQSARP